MQRAIFTIISSNYLHYARTLLQSAAVHHPDCKLHCILVDDDASHAMAFADEFAVVTIDELRLPEARRFIFRYTILELNTAVKPWAFAYLFAKGFNEVLYIDPDIRIYEPLGEVFNLLDGNADIVITPHLLAPIDDEDPTELDIRRAGTYNFGFCALARSANTDAFLRWWQAKLVEDCIVDLEAGIFVDQSWIDLVPGLFTNVAILRHPGYNVAYWNLAQRRMSVDADGWKVDGQPLVFFHFSGFNAEAPEAFSKHQNRLTLATMGASAALATEYGTLLITNGARTMRALPYGFGTFDDRATTVPDFFRKFYRDDRAMQSLLGDNPFSNPKILWTYAPVRRVGDLLPTYAMWSLWLVRADLRAAFPMSTDDSVASFYDWFQKEAFPLFSSSVIEAHAAIHASVVEMFPPSNTPALSNRKAAEAEERWTPSWMLEQLFVRTLDRAPEYEARASFQKQLESRSGLMRALLAIGLSRESRSKPGLWSRLSKAARMAVGYWAIGADMRIASQHLPAISAITRSEQLMAPSGWFVQDGDIVSSGIWCTPDAILPCPEQADGELCVRGSYWAELIERQTGSATCELKVLLDGSVIATEALTTTGEFIIRAPLQVGRRGGGLRELRFACSAHFVPKTIGLNEDRRQLAWRAHRVVVGDDVLLDSTRTRPIVSASEINAVDGVNLVGYVNAESGVGESLRSFARSCRSVGIRCSAFDVGYQSANRQTDSSLQDLIVEDHQFRVSVLHVNADQTPATLAVLPVHHLRAEIKIAYWHWEQPEFPASFLDSFAGLTEVWVPSGFVRDAVAKLSPIPVFEVPHAIAFAIAERADRVRFGLPTDRFLVLAMYDFDSYQVRKNPQAAIEAYRRACGERSDVGLVIKTINGSRNPDGQRELFDALQGLPNVYCIDDYLARDEVYALESACDCFISLHRSEGFGLGLAEMMYLGKPVIGTGWSGNMEFMTPMNSFPIEYELKPLERKVGVYEAGPLWAEADVDHASHVLRRVVEDAELRKVIGWRASTHMRRYFFNAEIGRQYRNRLSLITLRRG